MTDEYEVGYKKPPRQGQFKKGQSGNPKGRPKSSSFYDAFIKELEASITLSEKGEKTQVPRYEALIKRLMSDALHGNHQAQQKILKFIEKVGWDKKPPPESQKSKIRNASEYDRQVMKHYIRQNPQDLSQFLIDLFDLKDVKDMSKEHYVLVKKPMEDHVD